MSRELSTTAESDPPTGELHQKSYSSLYRRFILLTLICSVVPLLLVGWVIYSNYSSFAHARMEEFLYRRVEYNRKLIELFLKERTNDLQLMASTHSVDYLGDRSNLQRVIEKLNQEDPYFIDLGLINEQGRHVAYVGLFDLMDKDYSQTFWFKELMARGGFYVSDMFMGYRKTPHFIIGILWSDGSRKWILRATIENEFLDSLIGNVKLGETGEVFLVNRDGVYQTSPRFGGRIMDQSSLPMASFEGEGGVRILEAGESRTYKRQPSQVVGYAWLKEPQWVLVVKQDYAEAFRDVNHANTLALVFLHVSILAILIVSFLTTKHMIAVVRKRDEEANFLNRQLMQASKLASLGELAAGVAHEINNPLAIILTESQLVRDVAGDFPNLDPEFKAELIGSLSQIDDQVQRCNQITHNLLRFSRRSQAVPGLVDVNACLEEVVALLERRGITSGVEFVIDLDKDLPQLMTHPSQLQQVFVNLIANAIDAHDGKPHGTIRVHTRTNEKERGAEILIADTGSGIPPEIIDKVFDPFFTTKPVGKGTGLGLSISYKIVKDLGGKITVRSEVDKGTAFKIFLPFGSPKTLEGPAHDRDK